ncbi:hypothetical protein BC828DRAFT_349715 [Blastocladiella britannica]|nr:hypothetical protein BC828DRAFT_349715 [Blastocladiella britannica]
MANNIITLTLALVVVILCALLAHAGGPGRAGFAGVVAGGQQHSNYFFTKNGKLFVHSLYLGDIWKYELIKRIHSHYKQQLEAMGEKVSDVDAEFYFFSQYDLDADGHLDGTELRHAFLDYEYDEATTIAELDETIDEILREDDLDNDGRIGWDEYLQSETIHSHLSD